MWLLVDASGIPELLNKAVRLDVENHFPALDWIVQALVALPRGQRGPVLQKLVQNTISYQIEEFEVWRDPGVTWDLGFGDCDDQARLVHYLAILSGCEARLAYLSKDGEAIHVWAVVDGSACETTIQAHWGEDPIAAKKRLDRASF